MGFSRQEYWSSLPCPPPGGDLPDPEIEPGSHALQADSLLSEPPGREREVAQSCLTLRDPIDCSLPGSSIHGIFQARVMEWVAIAFSLNCTAAAAAAAKSLQPCPTLCDPIDGSPPGSPIPGILQARTLEWVAMKVKSESEVAQSCPTLSDPMDCSLPGFSVHGIFQAGVLEWGAIVINRVYLKTTKPLESLVRN